MYLPDSASSRSRSLRRPLDLFAEGSHFAGKIQTVGIFIVGSLLLGCDVHDLVRATHGLLVGRSNYLLSEREDHAAEQLAVIIII